LNIIELGTIKKDFKCYIFRQGGGTDAPLIAGSPYGYDQPMLDIDPSSSGSFPIYSPWRNLPKNRATATYSEDRGASTKDVDVVGADDKETDFPRVAAAPDGAAYTVFVEYLGSPNPSWTVTDFKLIQLINWYPAAGVVAGIVRWPCATCRSAPPPSAAAPQGETASPPGAGKGDGGMALRRALPTPQSLGPRDLCTIPTVAFPSVCTP
jgi:hypothetical protein